ncbi:MAG: adenosylcobinamide-phosphate synthase [Petroclostridium sp.]|nr:adenosylcobinamide-phosphate synthase [Petroclostridium sp.]
MVYYISIAYIIDLIIGDPHWLPHPICFIGNLIGKTEKFLRNAIDRSKQLNKAKTEKIAGIFLVMIVLLTVLLIISILLYFAKKIDVWVFKQALPITHYPLLTILTIYFLFSCLATKCLAVETRKVFFALKDNDLPQARKYLSYLVGRETSSLTEKEVIRAAVETVAENIVDGIVSPLFYAFIGGPVLAFIYKAINTMDSMVGYMNDRYINFGWAAAKLDDLANYIPARITGVVIPFASGIIGYDISRGYKIMWRDRRNHKSPNCAYPEAAVAGALGVRLGGTNVYFGKEVYKPAIGDEKRPLEIEDIARAIRIMYATSFLSLILFGIGYVLIK